MSQLSPNQSNEKSNETTVPTPSLSAADAHPTYSPNTRSFFKFARPRMNAFYAGALSAIATGAVAASLAYGMRVLATRSYGTITMGDSTDYFYNLALVVGLVGVLIATSLYIGLPLVYTLGKRRRTVVVTYVVEFVFLAGLFTAAIMLSGAPSDSFPGDCNYGLCQGVDLKSNVAM